MKMLLVAIFVLMSMVCAGLYHLTHEVEALVFAGITLVAAGVAWKSGIR